MPNLPDHLVPEEFAGNEWFVEEQYERYQQNKNQVAPSWWPIFESIDKAISGAPAGANATEAVASASTTATVEKDTPNTAPAAAEAPKKSAAAPAKDAPLAVPKADTPSPKAKKRGRSRR